MEQDSYVIFCIDSSALIDLHKYYGEQRIPKLWTELDSLFSKGNMLSHEIVYEELTTQAKNPSDLSKWVSHRKVFFKPITAQQVHHVASIVSQFPGLIDYKHEKDEADPWLIALALELKAQYSLFDSEVCLISQENPLSSQKSPAVCVHYKIRPLSLLDFFDFVGWKLEISLQGQD